MTTESGPGVSRLRRLVHAALLVLVYALGSSFALTEFLRYPGLNSTGTTELGDDFFGDMVYGRAPRPFVGRALVPLVVRGTLALVPAGARQTLAGQMAAVVRARGGEEWAARYPLELALTRVLLFGSLLGFAFVLRRLVARVLGPAGAGRDVVPVAALFGLTALYGFMSHVYDLPALFLFSLGLLLIAERRDTLFTAALAVATLNKETALLLVPVWLLVRSREVGWRKAAGAAALQVALWLAIRGAVMWAYHGNAGTELALRIGRNLAVLARPATYLNFRAVGGWLLVPAGLNVLLVAGLVWAAVSLRRAPGFLKSAFVVVPALIVLALLFGNVDEMRVYYEAYPVLLLIITGTITRLCSCPARS